MDCVAQGKLVVDRRLLVVTLLVINDAKVDMSEELSRNVGHLLVSRVVINCITIELRLCLAELHVIDTNAVVGKSFAVNVANGLADLQELFIRLHRHLVLAKVIEEDTC